MKSLNIALVGATGIVGRTMLKVLEQRRFPIAKLLPVASAKSIGKTIDFKGELLKVLGIETALEMDLDLVLFSAGGIISTEWAPKFASKGVVVIDNSSAFRMSENHKLIIPEINGSILTDLDIIIANPNCTTIQLLMALKPLHDLYNIERGVVSTYQSVTGTGSAAVNQLKDEREGEDGEKIYPYKIDLNCLPHCDEFQNNGYTREEMKVHLETKKIMGDHSIKLSCTAVRVPVTGGHSEAVYLEFSKDFKLDQVRSALSNFPGVVVQDDPTNNVYPMPLSSEGKDEVFVGRIRRDLSNSRGLHLWIVSDNLRKGAATNAIQIAEHLYLTGRWS
tara:strand:+ start:2165 stop:3166 length:1002 start_codon:yes stop_codon:yes gene_type:complete